MSAEAGQKGGHNAPDVAQMAGSVIYHTYRPRSTIFVGSEGMALPSATRIVAELNLKSNKEKE